MKHSRKKGQRVAAELLCDIAQTYVDPDQQEQDAILANKKFRGSQKCQNTRGKIPYVIGIHEVYG